jgi:DNA invertase Pin-like site-specific DNA recombinase
MARKKSPLFEESENRLIGYARVSTQDQSLETQLQMLKAAGVQDDDLYTDQISGAKTSRRGLNLALKALREGDTLVIYSLSRIGRSVEHLIAINKRLLDEGVALKSLTEEIDTRTAAGKLLFHLLAMVAQFERDVTIERTRAGVKAHQAAGLPHGRPAKLNEKQRARIGQMLANPKLTITAIAAKFGVSPATIKYHFPKPRIEYVAKKPKD